MKISRNDLDPDIINKLNRLDSAISTSGAGTTVVSYNGKEFVSIPIPENVREIKVEKNLITKQHIYDLKKRVLEPNTYDHSTYYEDMYLTKVPHLSASKLLKQIQTTSILNCSEGIYISKKYNNLLFVLDKKGIITRIQPSKEENAVAVSIVNLINNVFGKNINKNNILDFSILDDNSIFITTTNGIYTLDITTKEIEYLISEPDILFTDVFGKFLVVYKYESIDIYRLDGFIKIKRFFNVRNVSMIPYKSCILNNTLSLLTKTATKENLTTPLFLFKIDASGENVESVPCIFEDKLNNFRLDQISMDGEIISITGITENKRIVIINYNMPDNKETILEVDEKTDEVIEIISYLGSQLNKAIILTKEGKIIQIRNGEIIARLKSDVKKSMFIFEDIFVGTSEQSVKKILIPSYSTNSQEVRFKIPVNSNNIEIFFDMKPEKYNFQFLFNGIAILPENIIKTDIGVYVNLKNENLKNTEIVTTLNNDTILNGFVLVDNECF